MVMATPRIPPRPVAYVSSSAAIDEDQTNDDSKASTKRPEKPVAAKKPSLPAKANEDLPPPKPLRKSQCGSATDHDPPPKPARPRSSVEPAAAPPRPTRPPAAKSVVHKPVAAKESQSKPSSEPATKRPLITVISAKPMVSDTIPPPVATDDVKAEGKPNKPTKPARPPQMQHKDDGDKTLTSSTEGAKTESIKKSSSLERPAVKKRSSQETVFKPSVKLPPEPVSEQDVTPKVREGKRPPPPRPSYSVDNRSKSASEEAPSQEDGSDEKPMARSRTLSSSKKRKPPKPTPPVLPTAAKDVPEKSGEADQSVKSNRPTISKRSTLPRTPTLTEEDVPVTNKPEPTASTKNTNEKSPTTRPRTQSNAKRPPKPAPPKVAPPKPAPPRPKSAPSKNQKSDNTADDEHEQEAIQQDAPSDNVIPRATLPDQEPPVTNKPVDDTSSQDVNTQQKPHTSERPRTHSGSKHPPKPAPPKPAPPKSLVSDAAADGKEKLKEVAQSATSKDSPPPVEDTEVQESSRPALSKRTSSKKWQHTKPATSDQDIPAVKEPPPEEAEVKEENDEPPPRPLPPANDDFECNTEPSATESMNSSQQISSEEKQPTPPQVRKPLPPEAKKPSPPQTKKPAVTEMKKSSSLQRNKPSPPQTKKPSLPQTKKPSPPQTKKPSPPQTKKPSPPQPKRSPPEAITSLPPPVKKSEHLEPLDDQNLPEDKNSPKTEHEHIPPPKPAPSEILTKEDKLSETSLPDETPKEEDQLPGTQQPTEHKEHVDPPPKQKPKPPRPAMPSGPPRPAAPPKKKTPEPHTTESHLSDEPPPLPKRPTPGHPLYHYMTTEPRGISKFDYQPEDDDELLLLKDHLIELIERVDENWLYGRNVDNDSREGLVLEKYLKIIKRLPGEDKLSYLKELPSAVAMFDFEGENADELSFVAGDLIILLEKIDDVWLKGYIRSPQESGIFPAKFVEVVEPLPPPDKSIHEGSSSQSAITVPQSSSEDTNLGDEPYCIVESQFIAEGPGELSVEPGDKVILLERVNEDWLKGKFHDNAGIFPSAFVSVMVDLPAPSEQPSLETNQVTTPAETTPPKSEETKPNKPVGKCKAIFQFEGEHEGELSLQVGDIITTTAWVNNEWLQGMCIDKEGIFPLEFVQIIEDLPQESVAVSDKIPKNLSAETDLSPRAKAIQDHTASDGDELSFKAGDMIYLLEKISGGKFFEGELNNKVGKFPSSYVEIIVGLP